MSDDEFVWPACNVPVNRTRHGVRSAPCKHIAGARTTHPGYGPCAWHGGNRRRVERAWRIAMRLGEEYDVSPLEALPLAVRLAAAHVAKVERLLVDAEADIETPTGQLELLRRESRQERALLAKTAKAAVDAGVEVALVRHMQLEGQLVAAAVEAALDAAGDLPTELRIAALSAGMRALEQVASSPERLD